MEKGVQIKWVETIDSTNNELARHISDFDNLSVLAARYQEAGRGQRGNHWKSAAGENLTFSMMFKPGTPPFPSISATEQFPISEAATRAVSTFVRGQGVPCRIKWPNDIYVGDRKICGMLIENQLDARGNISSCIIGIGLNLNQIDFPPELMNPTSLRKVTGQMYDPESSLQGVCDCLAEQLLRLCTPEGKAALRQDYLSDLYRLGEWHAYTDCRCGQVFQGRIKGISEGGKLLVEMPDGQINAFGFKEISYIL